MPLHYANLPKKENKWGISQMISLPKWKAPLRSNGISLLLELDSQRASSLFSICLVWSHGDAYLPKPSLALSKKKPQTTGSLCVGEMEKLTLQRYRHSGLCWFAGCPSVSHWSSFVSRSKMCSATLKWRAVGLEGTSQLVSPFFYPVLVPGFGRRDRLWECIRFDYWILERIMLNKALEGRGYGNKAFLPWGLAVTKFVSNLKYQGKGTDRWRRVLGGKLLPAV